MLDKNMKYCLYARKSSESDEKQKMSIEAQLKEMKKIAKENALDIVEIISESRSAKLSNTRPEFARMLLLIRTREITGILTWNVDRLSRNGGDLGSLVDLMDEGLLQEIRTKSQTFRNTPNEKFLLMILCSQAKLENDNRGTNVHRGMMHVVEKGEFPHPLPFGYKRIQMYGKKKIVIDKKYADFIKSLFKIFLK